MLRRLTRLQASATPWRPRRVSLFRASSAALRGGGSSPLPTGRRGLLCNAAVNAHDSTQVCFSLFVSGILLLSLGYTACTTEPRKQNPSRVLVSYKYQLLGFDPTASSGMPFNTAKIYVGGKRRRNRVRAVNASDSPVARCIGAMLGVLLL